jgi:hypothetical protein
MKKSILNLNWDFNSCSKIIGWKLFVDCKSGFDGFADGWMDGSKARFNGMLTEFHKYA